MSTNSIANSLIIAACIFASALLGIYLRSALPHEHRSGDSKETLGRGMGLVATMAAIVLGMLVASAKANYDAQSNSLIQMCGNIVLLDRLLTNYGPAAKGAREALRDAVVNFRDRMQPKTRFRLGTPVVDAGLLYDQIQQLSPKDDAQRTLRAQALNMVIGVGQMRWLLYEQTTRSVPMPLLFVLVLWLAIIFTSFGIFAPSNLTSVLSLAISAVCVSGAIFLILEMYQLQGPIRVSAAPLQAAIADLLP